MIALSVSSRMRSHGRMPAAWTASRTSSTSPSDASWRAETFTDTRSGVPTAHAAWKTAAWRQASKSRSRPSGTMRPVSSASGMNSAGETGPRSGCVQRASDSYARISPLRRSTTGWYTSVISPSATARARSTLSSRRATAAACMAGS